MSQDEFSKEAGVSKRALIEWEKGATFPSASILEALSGIGVDVLYVITSRREGAPAGISAGSALETIGAAESVLEKAGALAADTADEVIAIACDDTLDDRIRARADLVIRFAMPGTEADKAAELRQSERRNRVQAEMDWARAVVADSIQTAGWTPSPQVVGHLVSLVRLYRVEGDAIMLLLHDLAALLPDRD